MSMTLVRIVALLASITAAVAVAQDRRVQEAHVHGVAAMNLALEGGELYLELRSPAANLVGFEHAPGTADEQAQVRRARALLGAPARLFGLPAGARCRLLDADVAVPWAADASHADHAHPGDTQAHADIHAEYRFRCDRPAALDRLDVLLFEMFPALQRLQVQYITADRQAAVELTPTQHALGL